MLKPKMRNIIEVETADTNTRVSEDSVMRGMVERGMAHVGTLL